jgi:carbonic anhydrase
MTSQESLTLLKNGNQRFVSNSSAYSNSDPDRRNELSNGQSPFAVILTCSDSRVAPEVIFDKRLGDLFVIRIAGNIVNEHILGSIEYAIEHLGSSLIVVLGHEKCGAVKAAVENYSREDNIASLVEEIKPGIEGISDMHEAVVSNAKFAASELIKRSSIIKTQLEDGKVELFPAIYDLETGNVNWL